MNDHAIEYKSGNTRELWITSYPLMLSWLAIVVMTFVDRLYLSKYSLPAHNCTVLASTMAWAFTSGLHTLCEMSQIFISRHNGAKDFKKIGPIVWQMLWVSLFSCLIFLPLAYFSRDLLFSNTEEGMLQADYFCTLIAFGPICGMAGSMTAFFIGRGHTLIVTMVAIISNIFNIIVDPILIFGIKGYIPSYGVKGAAVATGLGIVLEVIIFLFIFLKKKNENTFQTIQRKFDFKLTKKIIRTALPTTIILFIELLSWWLFYKMMDSISPHHMLVSGICQSILILFLFYGVGLQKAITAIAGNLIGAGYTDRLLQLIRSGIFLVLLFFLATTVIMIIFPEILISCFVSKELNDPNFNLMEVQSIIKFGLCITCFYLLFENIRFVFNGLLIAIGDTVFLMWSGVFALWTFLLCPAYFWILKYHIDIQKAMIIWVIYSFLAALITIVRYFSGSWKKKQNIKKEMVL